MEPLPLSARIFEPLATENPLEQSFRLHVPKDKWRGTPASLTVGSTTFAALDLDGVLKTAAVALDWGSYVFTDLKDADVAGWFALYFAKPKTAEEKETPFRTKTKFDDHVWHPILKAIVPIPDGFPRSTVAAVAGQKTLITGPNYNIRTVAVPGGSYGSQFIIEEFQAPTPFDIPLHRTPVPTEVSAQIAGKEVTYPAALHDDLNISGLRAVTGAVRVGEVAGDVAGVPSGVIAGQQFPATNFTTWQMHVVHDDQEFRNGLWYRVRIRVRPPNLPDEISQ